MDDDNKPKMNDIQYRTITQLIAENDEDNRRSIKEVKKDLSDMINVNMGYIKDEISGMHFTLREHNSRLRKSEIHAIRREEREKVVQERLLNQETICKSHIVKTTNLAALNKTIEWVKNNPWKVIGVIFGILGGLLTMANALFHWFDKLI